MDQKLEDLVLWEDDHILMINKPSGLLALPDGYEPALPHLKSVLEPAYGRLWIVHRLDRETSGILALGRSKAAHRQLNTLFKERKVEKIYHALVIGNPPWEEVRVELPLRTDGDRKHRTVVDRVQGKDSLTTFQVLRRFNAFVLLEASPKTGRTHQIRAHLSAIEYPIIGDKLYGIAGHPLQDRLPRLGLHAVSLTFDHPISGNRVSFEAPTPEDFIEFLSSASS